MADENRKRTIEGDGYTIEVTENVEPPEGAVDLGELLEENDGDTASAVAELIGKAEGRDPEEVRKDLSDGI